MADPTSDPVADWNVGEGPDGQALTRAQLGERYAPLFEQAALGHAERGKAKEGYYTALGQMPGIYGAGAEARSRAARSSAAGVSGDLSLDLAQTGARNPFMGQQVALAGARERANIMAGAQEDITALRAQERQAQAQFFSEKGAELTEGEAGNEEAARLTGQLTAFMDTEGLNFIGQEAGGTDWQLMYQEAERLMSSAGYPESQKALRNAAMYYYYRSFMDHGGAMTAAGLQNTYGIPMPGGGA